MRGGGGAGGLAQAPGPEFAEPRKRPPVAGNPLPHRRASTSSGLRDKVGALVPQQSFEADARPVQAPPKQGRLGKSPRVTHTETHTQTRRNRGTGNKTNKQTKSKPPQPERAQSYTESRRPSPHSVSPEAAGSPRPSRPAEGLQRTASSATVPQCPERGRTQEDRLRPLVVALRTQVRERPLGPPARRVRTGPWCPDHARSGTPPPPGPAVAIVLPG